MPNVEERVRDIIVQELNVDSAQVTPEAKFIEDLGADSLDNVELIMAFEDEFDIKIPDEEAESIANGKNAIDYIAAHRN